MKKNDNKMRKAIRLCCGYTDDLRVDLSDKPFLDIVESFICNNALAIFGSDVFSKSEEKRDEIFRRAAWNVCRR